MADRTYYVMCDDNCRFEAMTKEQVIAAIAEATGNTPTDIDSAFITKIKEINKGAAVQIWLGTTAEYNVLETIDDNVFYIKTDDTRISDLEKALAENTEALQDGINSNIRRVFSVQWDRSTDEITAESEDYLTSLYNAIRNGENVEIRATDTSGYIHLLTVSDISRVFISVVDPRYGYLYSWRLGEGYITFWGKGIATAQDTVFEVGTEKNWNYQKWTSGKIECWAVRNVLITECEEISAPAGVKYVLGATAVPSFVTADNSIINATPQNSYIIGCNAGINEDGFLCINMYGKSSEMTSIDTTQQLPVSVHIICNYT